MFCIRFLIRFCSEFEKREKERARGQKTILFLNRINPRCDRNQSTRLLIQKMHDFVAFISLHGIKEFPFRSYFSFWFIGGPEVTLFPSSNEIDANTRSEPFSMEIQRERETLTTQNTIFTCIKSVLLYILRFFAFAYYSLSFSLTSTLCSSNYFLLFVCLSVHASAMLIDLNFHASTSLSDIFFSSELAARVCVCECVCPDSRAI